MDKREAKRIRMVRWRKENPEKVAAQQRRATERKQAKRAAFLAANPPPTPEERAARAKEKEREYNRLYRAANKDKIREQNRRYWEAHKDDPAFRARKNELKRQEYRIKHGIPLDTPVSTRSRKYATEEERLAARRETKRLEYAKKRGTTVEEIDARKAEREAASPGKKLFLSRKGKDSTQRAAEKRAAAVKAERCAAAAVRKAPPAPPKISPDPPELVALFAKASKGQPPMPYNPKVRKLSVFHLRGMR